MVNGVGVNVAGVMVGGAAAEGTDAAGGRTAGGCAMGATAPVDCVTGTEAAGDVLFWRVADAAGRVVWSGGDPSASTLLQAGRYVIRWTAAGQRREQAVEVRAGSITSAKLVP